MSNYLFLLLVLACPLMMIWMMRGHRGHGSSAGGGHDHSEPNIALDELRRQREQLDREIEAHESQEKTPTPVGGGWR